MVPFEISIEIFIDYAMIEALLYNINLKKKVVLRRISNLIMTLRRQTQVNTKWNRWLLYNNGIFNERKGNFKLIGYSKRYQASNFFFKS